MWTAIVLVCTALPTPSCVSSGGPDFATEEECINNFAEVGIPHLVRTYPNSKIAGARCIMWGPNDLKDDVAL